MAVPDAGAGGAAAVAGAPGQVCAAEGAGQRARELVLVCQGGVRGQGGGGAWGRVVVVYRGRVVCGGRVVVV